MNENNNNKTNYNSVRLVKNSYEGKLDVSSLFVLLYESYRKTRNKKRNTDSQLIFEFNLEKELLKLAKELYNRTYKLSPSKCFINVVNVKREVIASDFRDRIVHHLLCGWLFPIFEKLFIHDSYSCRENKGTLYGINCIRKFVKSSYNKNQSECWVLKLDIKGFFMSIDKNLLYKFIIEGLDKKKWENIPDRDLCDFLIRLFVFNVPIDNAIFKTSPNMWLNLPNDKTLITNDNDKGLPIGDLTSQLFGNVYLNNLDQYIKHALKIKYYGRYVDDMVLISNDKEKLLKSIEYIRKFLEDELLLKLHPNKIQLQHAKLGFNFIGARIYPFHVSPTKRIISNYKKLEEIKDYTKYVKKQSYLGIFKYMNGCEKLKTL